MLINLRNAKLVFCWCYIAAMMIDRRTSGAMVMQSAVSRHEDPADAVAAVAELEDGRED